MDTTTRTLGSEIAKAGLTRVGFYDVNTGARTYGTFDPAGTTAEERYGPQGYRIRGWFPENYASGHSGAGQTTPNWLAPELGLKVYGVERTDWDLADCCFVDGATQHILHEAVRLNFLDESELHVTVPTVQPTTPTPPADPCALLRSEVQTLLGQNAAMVTQLKAATEKLGLIDAEVTQTITRFAGVGGRPMQSLKRVKTILTAK